MFDWLVFLVYHATAYIIVQFWGAQFHIVKEAGMPGEINRPSIRKLTMVINLDCSWIEIQTTQLLEVELRILKCRNVWFQCRSLLNCSSSNDHDQRRFHSVLLATVFLFVVFFLSTILFAIIRCAIIYYPFHLFNSTLAANNNKTFFIKLSLQLSGILLKKRT